MIDQLRRRFAIARLCVVADRGLISAETPAELEERRLLYILGVRERIRQTSTSRPIPQRSKRRNGSRASSCYAPTHPAQPARSHALLMWTMEQTFRTAKHPLATRRIFYKLR